MRLFTGLDLPESVRASLGSLIDELRGDHPADGVRWSPLANLHITTRFIGDWPEDRLADLQSALTEVGRAQAPATVRLHGLGTFPRETGFLFAKVDDSEGKLGALAAATDAALEQRFGLAPEARTYTPHVTLARMNRRQLPAGLDHHTPGEIGSFTAASFFLYQSDFYTYTKLSEFPLLAL